MQPSVSIGYSSQSGFGALGIGWDVSGISAISRTPQNLYFDGTDGKIQTNSIQFNENDRLSLDGQRLILLNDEEYLSSDAEYGTEIENYSRIKMHTSDETEAIYFVLTTVDGKVLEFGKTPNSIVKNNDPNVTDDNRILSWKLNRVTDVYGNYIEYIYIENGQYISAINYTGTSTKNPIKSVNFTYEENTFNPKLFYIGNFQIKQNKTLNAITTKSNQLVLRQYDFGYDAENRLKTVTETAQGSEKMNSTTIQWGSDNLISPNNIQEIPVTAVVDHKFITHEKRESNGFIQAADVNGDGYSDRVECWLGSSTENGYFKCYLYNKDTQAFNSEAISYEFQYIPDGANYQPKFTTSDINNDGKNEIIAVIGGRVFQIKHEMKGYIDYYDDLTIIKPTPSTYTYGTETQYNINRTYEIFSANVNNDRYTDIIIAYNHYESLCSA